ncbi:hypothetical protein [Mesobacterium pallidum]|uniref:hypothetical protein n=1 Tax=Mesobacterium pallidum TaxID=2872037 RepID=UPI001EE36FF6|nr:hypothetical protein [Mesobacterium pallidum]
MAKGWYIDRGVDVVTVSRRVPVRFDLAVEARLPLARSLTRVAQQVRQDLWRALRDLRGFAPAVRVERQADALLVRAGGQVDGPIPATAARRVAALLESPVHRARWQRWAS